MDQNSEFTAKEFEEILEENEIQISMDGKERALDIIFIISNNYSVLQIGIASFGMFLYLCQNKNGDKPQGEVQERREERLKKICYFKGLN